MCRKKKKGEGVEKFEKELTEFVDKKEELGDKFWWKITQMDNDSLLRWKIKDELTEKKWGNILDFEMARRTGLSIHNLHRITMKLSVAIVFLTFYSAVLPILENKGINYIIGGAIFVFVLVVLFLLWCFFPYRDTKRIKQLIASILK